MHRFWAIIGILSILIVLCVYVGFDSNRHYTFAEPIAAISFGAQGHVEAQVRGFDGENWTEWQDLEIETEFDPLMTETNLIMFPRDVVHVELRGNTESLEPHPVRVSTDPVRYSVAARVPVQRPRIFKRRQWGADETFLVRGPKIVKSDLPDATRSDSPTPSIAASHTEKRVVDCAKLQQDFPHEFTTVGTVRQNAHGETLRWPQSYSPKILALVVHHTAIAVTGDKRPPAERVRALHAYHANNREWGDIGYNYVIDEFGQIYEGRAGGDKVVAGHAYCHNVGTLGIALLGNFEREKPTPEQIASLQWLLHDLATEHRINLNRQVYFHGQTIDPILGHGELISTVCPGYYMKAVIDQVYTNVRSGNITATVQFPSFASRYKNRTSERLNRRRARLPSGGISTVAQESLAVRGSAKLRGRPGSQQLISLHYQAGAQNKRKGMTIGTITRSSQDVGVWLGVNGEFKRLRNELHLPSSVPARGTTQLTLKVQFPKEPGTSTLKIGSVLLKLESQGRQLRSVEAATARVQNRTRVSTPTRQPTRVRSPRTTRQSTRRTIRSRNTNRTVRPSRRSPRNTRVRSQSRRPQASTGNGPAIRIRLGADSTPQIVLPNGGQIGSVSVDAGFSTTVRVFGNSCGAPLGRGATTRQTEVEAAVLRIHSADDSPVSIISSAGSYQYLGMIECRIIDGELVLINELPLEDYMRGLAEEPDTEPFEKQRAFAIAARSYAASYMGETRKFPGKPYDGDDSPARFQKYIGVTFAERNPRWVEAVNSTQLQVLHIGRKPVRAAYYSSNDGRTRSPAEVGWPHFPNAEVFYSKSDPWCKGLTLRGHGVGMSGCGAKGQAEEGRTAEEILAYYYPGTAILPLRL